MTQLQHSVVACEWVSWLIWSHSLTDGFESSRDTHSHATTAAVCCHWVTNESRHSFTCYYWATTLIRMPPLGATIESRTSHDTHSHALECRESASYHPHSDMSHLCMSHVTHMDASCHTTLWWHVNECCGLINLPPECRVVNMCHLIHTSIINNLSHFPLESRHTPDNAMTHAESRHTLANAVNSLCTDATHMIILWKICAQMSHIWFYLCTNVTHKIAWIIWTWLIHMCDVTRLCAQMFDLCTGLNCLCTNVTHMIV